MEYFILIILFIIGTLIGSFCTLAVYRIPKHKDIVFERSFCPNCNHKLAFLDLIPVLSYIFLGGKCRYCGEKIRLRYLLLEIFSGVSVVLLACSLNIQILTIQGLVYLALGILYVIALTLIAGIDKEYYQINKGVYLFAVSVMILYMIYLYVIEQTTVIYRYAIYMFLIIVAALLNIIYIKKKKDFKYSTQILGLSLLMMLFTGTNCFVFTVIFTLFAIAGKLIHNKFIDVKDKKIPIGFIMCVLNIAFLILQNLIY